MQLIQLVSIQQQEATKLDVEAAFAKYRTRLPRLLRGRIGASESVIEEACQVAWLRLVEHASDVHEEAVLGWLLTTAWHAALKQLRCDRRVTSLEAVGEKDGALGAGMPGVIELAEQHEVLQAVAHLPPRQQRTLWLRALGFSYDEAASHEGCTRRTFERQLEFGRRGLRALMAGEEAAA